MGVADNLTKTCWAARSPISNLLSSGLVLLAIIMVLLPLCVASAQLRTGASNAGRIFNVADGHSPSGVTVSLEGTAFTTHSDSKCDVTPRT